jgi:hypothetical protein
MHLDIHTKDVAYLRGGGLYCVGKNMSRGIQHKSLSYFCSVTGQNFKYCDSQRTPLQQKKLRLENPSCQAQKHNLMYVGIIGLTTHKFLPYAMYIGKDVWMVDKGINRPK